MLPEIKIKHTNITTTSIKNGWYKVSHSNDEFNRIVYVRGEKVFVFSLSFPETPQFFSVKQAQGIYDNWTPLKNMKIEVD